jgi:hypothetical protein
VRGARRTLLLTLGVVLLGVFAHAPLVRAGFAGDDWRVLVVAGDEAGPAGDVPLPWDRDAAELVRIEGEGGTLLGGSSLALSRRLWGLPHHQEGAVPAAWPWRLENLLLLLAAAFALRPFVRRLFLPWVGSEQARAAGWASAALLFVHPLSGFAVAGLSSRGALIGVLLANASAASFLAARQERKALWAVVAALCCVLAGLSADAALVIPIVLAGAEFFSAHRYRTLHDRARTAGTTLLGYGGAVAAGLGLRSAATGIGIGTSLEASFGRVARAEDTAGALELYVEKLGMLVLPVNAHGAAVLGIALAGVLFLLGVQPALLAARSAPRLWGWLLASWLVAGALALLPVADVRVSPEDTSRAAALFSATAVVVIGLALSATAISGMRRTLLPLGLAVGYALLAQGNARPLVEASRVAEDLRADVEEARVYHGREARVLVVDPPHRVRGVAAVGDSIHWLLHPALTGEDRPGGEEARRFVRGIERGGLLALAREREFDALREDPLLLVCPSGELGPRAEVAALPSGERISLRLPSPRASSGRRNWRGDSRSSPLDLASLRARCLRVVAPSGVDTSRPQSVSWRASEPAVREGAARGVWVGGGESPEAVFDLGASLAWVLGDRIQRIWFEGLPTVELAEVLESLPALAQDGEPLVPAQDGEDWVFDLPTGPVLVATRERGTFVVGLLDLSSWDHVELPVRTEGTGTLRVRGAAERVADWFRASGGGAVAWHLDWRVDGETVARARGRRVGRAGSREADESL